MQGRGLTLESLIETHGYWLVFVGTFLEGETVLLLAGVAAQRGYLDPAGVVVAAFAGALAGDNFFFHLGRHLGHGILARRPGWRDRIERIDALLAGHRVLLIFGFRFLYGLRIATPLALGTGRVGPVRFALLDAAGAAFWSVAIGAAGYGLGSAAGRLLHPLRRYELVIFATIIAAVLGLRLLGRRRRRRPPDA